MLVACRYDAKIPWKSYDSEESTFCRREDHAGKLAIIQETLSEARIPLRTGVRNDGSGLRQSRNPVPMQASTQEFIALLPSMQPGIQSREEHKQILAAQVLRSGTPLRLVARGLSMLPTLWPGDRLTLEGQALDRVREGDVVLFVRDGRFFIHRVLRTSDAGGNVCLTRGDAMPDADAAVRPEELLGRVVSVRRYGRKFPVPACSPIARGVGLALAYYDPLRNLVLRVHAWRSRRPVANTSFAPTQVPLG